MKKGKSLWTYQNVIVSEKFFTNKQPGGPSSRPTQHRKIFFFFTKIHVNFLKTCVNFSNKNYHRFSSKITWTQAQTACHVIFVENLWYFFFEKSHDFFWKSLKQKLVSSLVRTFYIKQSSYKSTSKYEFNRPRLKFW